MGTHPIFESDFDCLTEIEELISEMEVIEKLNGSMELITEKERTCEDPEVRSDLKIIKENLSEAKNKLVKLVKKLQNKAYKCEKQAGLFANEQCEQSDDELTQMWCENEQKHREFDNLQKEIKKVIKILD